MPPPSVIAGAAFALLALLAFGKAVSVYRRRRILGAGVWTLCALLFLVSGLLCASIVLGLRGYHALTREQLAATVVVEPLAAQTFSASFTFPDGRQQTFELHGDQLYVDAHILKWKPLANVLGLHTDYALARVGGRYGDIEHERTRPRSVFSLAGSNAVDLFTWRRRLAFLSPLYVAEYGSGSFAAADQPVTLQVLVSTTGLLMRPVPPSAMTQ